MRRAVAPPEPEGNEGEKGSANAEPCRDTPVGLVRYRLAKAKFGFPPRIVIKPPIAADSPFQKALPRLVEGFDQIHLPILLLSCRYDVGQDTSLIGRRGERTVAHPPFARPAHLAD